MSGKDKDEFRRELTFALLTYLRANDLVFAKRDLDGHAVSGFAEDEDAATDALVERTRVIVENLTADWSVDKGSPSSHDHPLYDGPEMVRFKIRTKPRELNAAELAEKAKWSAHFDWTRSDFSTPPPETIGFVDLLRQTVWFNSTTKLDDMAPGERLRTRKFLLANAGKMHRAAAIRLAGCPDDGVVERFLDEDPKQWLAGEPLMKRLDELIELDGKRPCGHRWGDQEGVGDEPCSMSGDYRHQCDRRRSHKKPHRCLFCQVEQGRTIQDTPPSADTSIADLLDQNVWWVTRKGEVLKLVDMKPSHRAHTLAYLQRNADQIMHNAVGRYMTEDAPDQVKVAFLKTSYADMLADTQLVQRLTVLVSGDIQDGAR